MVTVFLVCWGPYAVLSIIGVLGYHKVWEVHIYDISYVLGYHKVGEVHVIRHWEDLIGLLLECKISHHGKETSQ